MRAWIAASVAGFPPGPSAVKPIGAGACSNGAVVSCTVMLAVALAMLPKRSVALNVTAVVVLSESRAGTLLVKTGTAAVSVTRARASQATTTELVLGDPVGCVASIVMLGGGLTVIVVVTSMLVIVVDVEELSH